MTARRRLLPLAFWPFALLACGGGSDDRPAEERVPRLVGMTQRDAECRLERLGLRWRYPRERRARSSASHPCDQSVAVTPNPRVVDQSPPPERPAGHRVVITLETECTRRRRPCP